MNRGESWPESCVTETEALGLKNHEKIAACRVYSTVLSIVQSLQYCPKYSKVIGVEIIYTYCTVNIGIEI